ncbi:hypothetical protein B0H16DRAFT_1453301 [Mycena metata]|uniref:Uncharacterized protein n=1 Tax=Mycena metata TaxID=1033252 RepID=A0AAD7JLY6_9AGAR|nr:hypothetical protein B0H16DRAFT_1453301 [Mycena metata]
MAEKPAQPNDSDSVFLNNNGSMLDPVLNVPVNMQPPALTLFPGLAPSTMPQPTPIAQPVTQQTLLPGVSAPTHSTTSETQSRRCALCVKNLCPKREGCLGKGGHKHCTCGHPALAPNERVRWTEAMVLAKIAARDREQRRIFATCVNAWRASGARNIHADCAVHVQILPWLAAYTVRGTLADSVPHILTKWCTRHQDVVGSGCPFSLSGSSLSPHPVGALQVSWWEKRSVAETCREEIRRLDLNLKTHWLDDVLSINGVRRGGSS